MPWDRPSSFVACQAGAAGLWRLALCAIKQARQNFPLNFFSEMVYSTLDGSLN